jgi:endonuclease YncB( thermonuclease family)
MLRELASLPLPIKIMVVLFLLAEFVVVTQSSRLGLERLWWPRVRMHPNVVAVPKTPIAVAPPQIERPPPVAPIVPTVSIAPSVPEQVTIGQENIQAYLLKRIGRFVIDNPTVQPDGSIPGNGCTLYLYGVGPIDTKKFCIRASGERWACGLRAYATFRNTVEHKKMTCDPKDILPNGLAVSCRVGVMDVGLMLVREGLVELQADINDSQMTDAVNLSKGQRLGIWDR